jgi:hypothetical protein
VLDGRADGTYCNLDYHLGPVARALFLAWMQHDLNLADVEPLVHAKRRNDDN